MLIGWSDDAGELVGCIAVERAGPDDLEVRALNVPDLEAAAMLDALSDVVTAERLLAETDATGADIYTRSGFTAEPLPDGRFRCTRAIDVETAPAAAVGATTLTESKRLSEPRGVATPRTIRTNGRSRTRRADSAR